MGSESHIFPGWRKGGRGELSLPAKNGCNNSSYLMALNIFIIPWAVFA